MKKECIVMSITNQKGGVGKTTTTVNLGIGLANEGHKVLMIDFDPQGDMTTCLGLTLLLKKLSDDTKVTTKVEWHLNDVGCIVELETSNHWIQAVYHNDS